MSGLLVSMITGETTSPYLYFQGEHPNISTGYMFTIIYSTIKCDGKMYVFLFRWMQAREAELCSVCEEE